jgi:3-phenylpropionate/cinnamic acid dioxygenase small subunit
MLSADDRFAIQDLYARHNACVDLRDHLGWAACFTEDGVSDTIRRSEGREALLAHGKARDEARASQPWTVPLHWETNFVIEGDGTAARAIVYMMRTVKMKETGAFVADTAGIYEDQLTKVNGNWLFKHRKLHLDEPPASIIPNAG